MKHWGQLSLFVIFTISAGTLSTQAADETKPALSVDKNSSAVVKTQAIKDSVQQSPWVQHLEENLGQKILGISAWQYIAAFLAIIAGLILKRIILSYIQKKIESYVSKTKAEWDDQLFEAIIKPVNAFVMIGAVHIAAFLLIFNLASFPTELIGKSYSIFLGLSIIWLVYRLVDVAAHYVDELLAKADEGLLLKENIDSKTPGIDELKKGWNLLLIRACWINNWNFKGHWTQSKPLWPFRVQIQDGEGNPIKNLSFDSDKWAPLN